MTYTLYYAPGVASLAVHWALLELGVPFEARALSLEAGDQRTPAYLKLNPAGRVPTLVVDGEGVGEAVAILMLLAERHPDACLAPPPGAPDRARWLETMVFIANGLAAPFRDWFYADKDGDPAGADAVRALARRRIEAAWDRLGARLAAGGPCTCAGPATCRAPPAPGRPWPPTWSGCPPDLATPNSSASRPSRPGLEIWTHGHSAASR